MVGWRNTAIQRFVTDTMSRLLAEMNHAGDIGSVVDMLTSESLRKLAKKTLIRLFPLLDETNASLVSSAHYAQLHKELLECDAEFTLVLLSLFTAVRDYSAIESVERVSRGGGCLARRNERIRAEAANCLAMLQT